MNGLETRMLAAAENQTRHLRNISENLERLVDLLEKQFTENPVMAMEGQFEKNLSAAMNDNEANEPEQPKDEFTRPCPVCKTTEHLEVEVHDLCWTVCCNGCYKIRGPYCNDRETAIAAWNSDKE